MPQLTNMPQTIAALAAILIVMVFGGCKKESIVSPITETRSFPSESRSIDVDGNGSVDFVFSYFGYQTTDYPPSAASWLLNVRANDSNQVQFTNTDGPIPLQDSVLIDGAIGWSDYGASLASVNWHLSTGWDSSWSGIWIGVGERSLGVRLRKEGMYHYGWIKLSVGVRDGILSISDFAYQTLPNTPILAGIHP